PDRTPGARPDRRRREVGPDGRAAHAAHDETAGALPRLDARRLDAVERIRELGRLVEHVVDHPARVDRFDRLAREVAHPTRSPGSTRAPRATTLPSPTVAPLPTIAPGSTPAPSPTRTPPASTPSRMPPSAPPCTPPSR